MKNTSHFPDFAKYAKQGLCPCPWRGEDDSTCRPMFHTVYRIPDNGQTPARLAGYHFIAVNRHTMHLWRRDEYTPQGMTVGEDKEILESLSGIPPRMGLEVLLARDSILDSLPPDVLSFRKGKTIHVVAFRLTYAGDFAWHILTSLDGNSYRLPPLPPGFEEPDGQVVHKLSAKLLRDALLGVGLTFRMWLPEDPYGVITIEGDSTRTLIAPVQP
jgi:hypothetical protein